MQERQNKFMIGIGNFLFMMEVLPQLECSSQLKQRGYDETACSRLSPDPG